MTKTTGREYERRSSRYAIGLTGKEFSLIAETLPEKKRPGRSRGTEFLELINAVPYPLCTDCRSGYDGGNVTEGFRRYFYIEANREFGIETETPPTEDQAR